MPQPFSSPPLIHLINKLSIFFLCFPSTTFHIAYRTFSISDLKEGTTNENVNFKKCTFSIFRLFGISYSLRIMTPIEFACNGMYKKYIRTENDSYARNLRLSNQFWMVRKKKLRSEKSVINSYASHFVHEFPFPRIQEWISAMENMKQFNKLVLINYSTTTLYFKCVQE